MDAKAEQQRRRIIRRYCAGDVAGERGAGDGMNLSAAEQAVVEDMVAMRSVDSEGPPWMQQHRLRYVRAEARRRIAALPPRPKSPTGRSSGQTYWAPRRVIRVGSGKHV